MPLSIAIDGPAAAGKTTVAEDLAQALGYLYFDTGLMYRAATLCSLREGIDISDEAKIIETLEAIEVDVRAADQDETGTPHIYLGDEDVSDQLRTPQVDEYVSQIAAYPQVRDLLTEKQRKIGARGNIVMVGRDIGTVVLPDADLKIYMDATVEARAHRRFAEFKAQGKQITYEDILQVTKQRDQIDSQRDVAPLKPADDAIIIDTTNMEKDEVLQHILGIVRERQKS